LIVVENEKRAREVVEYRARHKLEEKQAEERMAVREKEKAQQDEPKREPTEVKEIPAVLKADVHGSIQAIESTLLDIPQDEVKLKIIRSGVGEVSEADVQSVAEYGGIVLAFNTKISAGAADLSRVAKIQIIESNVIYQVVDGCRDFLSGLLAPKMETEILGVAEVLQTFNITNKKAPYTLVAGCSITNGSIHRNSTVRVLRGGNVIHEGTIASLKRIKEDITEAKQGTECGMALDKGFAPAAGDIIQAFKIRSVSRKLGEKPKTQFKK